MVTDLDKDPTSTAQPTVLLIATRPLGPPVTGRKMVLQTIVSSLATLGFRVVVATFGTADENPTAEDLRAVEVIQLRGPNPVRVVAGALGRRRTWSLNELLWWSPAVADQLREAVDEHRVDLVVADGIRTARYAEELGLPWFCDLDDLFSDRYESWAGQDLRLSDIVGFRAPRSAALQRVLAKLRAAPILRREAARLRRREVQVARAADGVSLISADEAAVLGARAGRAILDLPMAVSVDVGVARTWDAHDPADHRMAFTGAVTWWPNLDAVALWAQELAPQLSRRGLVDYQLHVFGDAPDAVREQLAGPAVRFHGRKSQPDLRAALAGFPLLLVPQRDPMGLTTKIIESALIGTVVLTTRAGASGMAVRDRRELLLFDDVDELEAQLRWAAEHPDELAAIADRARSWAVEHYSAEAVAERWRLALTDTFPHLTSTVLPGAGSAGPATSPAGELS